MCIMQDMVVSLLNVKRIEICKHPLFKTTLNYPRN